MDMLTATQRNYLTIHRMLGNCDSVVDASSLMVH